MSTTTAPRDTPHVYPPVLTSTAQVVREVSPDSSKVFVTGGSVGSTGTNDYATVAYDASTGAKLWVKRYDGKGKVVNDTAHALGVSPDGSKLFVTGESAESTGSYDYATIALDANSGPDYGYSISRARAGSATPLMPVPLGSAPTGPRYP